MSFGKGDVTSPSRLLVVSPSETVLSLELKMQTQKRVRAQSYDLKIMHLKAELWLAG
jgi:hypothetical protein